MLLKGIFVPLSNCSNKHYETKELHIPLQHAAADDDANVQRTLVGSIVSTLDLVTVSKDKITFMHTKRNRRARSSDWFRFTFIITYTALYHYVTLFSS